MVQYMGSGGPGNAPPMGGKYGNYSSDLDKLRAMANAVAQQKAAEELQSTGAASPNPGGLEFTTTPSVDNTDYLALAQQMYAPQTQYLDQQAAAAKARNAANSKELAGIYGQTVKDILGMQGGIKSNFGQGIAGVKGAYNTAYNQTGAAFDKSTNDQLAILQRLGIQQAAPNTVQQGADARALLQGIIAANSQGSQNALQQMQQAALAFNTEQGNITRQSGAEAQTGLKHILEDQLGKIAGTKADLMGQINQQAFGMRSDAQKSAIQAQQDAYNRYKDERDFNYRMAQDKAALDLKKLAMAGKDTAASDPMGKVYALATSIYPNAQAASNATRLVSEALSGANGPITTAAQFIQAVTDRANRANPGAHDIPELQRLAALMFSELYGKSSPAGPFGG